MTTMVSLVGPTAHQEMAYGRLAVAYDSSGCRATLAMTIRG